MHSHKPFETIIAASFFENWLFLNSSRSLILGERGERLMR